MTQVDDLDIDALVAGELQGDAYRQVIRQLDASPDGWKQCALAFLEEQAFSQDLQAIASSSGDTWSLPISAPGTAGPTVTVPQTEMPGARLQWLTRITSIAAMLLVSFTVGWYGSGLAGSGRTAVAPDLGTSTVAGTLDPSNSIAADSNPTDGGFTPRDRSQIRYLPESDVFSFEEDQAAQPEFVRLLKKLEQNGRIDFESTNQLVPVQDGDSVRFVPVQHFRVRPKVYSY